MSTGQVIQLAANAAGYYFGGPWGAMLGNAAGGYVGRSVDARHTDVSAEGPRLSDYKVQLASYGVAVPRVYGRASIAGNVIWSSDIIEHVTTSSSTQDAGKGGAGDSQTLTQTTYSYSVHLAIGLCAGPIAGLGKIWANGKLIYNGKAGTDAQTVLASQTLADGIRLYLGSETQNADALIQSFEGAANVPAYRGLAYIVLEDFQLANFGNRIPQFEFEIIASATTQLPGLMATIPTTGFGNTLEYDNGTYSVGFTSVTAAAGGTGTFEKKTYDIAGTLLADQTTTRLRAVGSSLIPIGNWHAIVLADNGTAGSVFWNLETGETVEAAWLPPLAVVAPMLYKGNDYAFMLYRASANNQVTLARIPLGAGYGSEWAPTARTMMNDYPDKAIDLWISAANDRLFFDGTWVWVADTTNGILYRYTQDLVLSKQWSYATPGASHGFIYIFDHRFAIAPAASGARLFDLNDDGTVTLLVNVSWDSGSTVIPYPPTPGTLIGLTKIHTVYPLITSTLATLSAVVQAECLLGGLAAGDLDVTALTDNVRGYVVSRSALRSCIEPLARSFFFDAIESDGKLKFVKRNGASVLTLATTDLAAHAPGEALPEPLHHEHAMDLELPSEVGLMFFDDDAAYQQGTQYARRLATNAVGQVSIDVPIVLSEAEGLHIAQALLFDAWAARETFTFQTSRKFSKYEPGDIFTLPFPANDTTAVRVTKRDDGANGVIRWEAAFCEPTIYTQTQAAASAETPAETTSVPGPTLVELMDLPLLRDVDDSYGFYVAALGYLAEWRGAQLYISRDGGGTYDDMEAGLLLVESTIGFAETVLGSPIWLEQFDEKCTVDVRLVEGSLASVTRTDVLNGLNVALLGDEIIQFRTATALSATQWRLSGLLRGRLGTDWAVGAHAINERFVLLDRAAARFVRQGSADVGVEHMVKAVSIGNRLAGTPENLFTYGGINLKPLSPVQLAGGRDPTGNLNLAWRRRTRLNATWRNYVDAPLGEETESYSIDVMNGAAVARTIAASTNVAQYTAAQQTTDFGAPQAAVTLNLYQVSSRVGRGYAASATL
jgi:hypothetical protein